VRPDGLGSDGNGLFCFGRYSQPSPPLPPSTKRVFGLLTVNLWPRRSKLPPE
jgi:hypothetical protein